MKKDILVIFDYSGTLSVEAPLYGSYNNLQEQLERTGLKALGIKTPKLFWEKIVNPTWQRGSTTTIGYNQVMQARIKEMMLQKSLPIDEPAISQAVCLFVDDYLRQSGIDYRWRQILKKLHKMPRARTVIATDHYAEATDVIISYLYNWEINSIPAIKFIADIHGIEPFIVANSADIGFIKSDRNFWNPIKTIQGSDDFKHLILIDDFGHHEQMEDHYSLQEAVGKRKKETIHLLQEIFHVNIMAIPFYLDTPTMTTNREEYYDRLIEKTSSIIDSYLKF